jgi:hypothetical protein
LRYDQWKVFESEVANYYKKEVPYYAIFHNNMLETRFSPV